MDSPEFSRQHKSMLHYQPTNPNSGPDPYPNPNPNPTQTYIQDGVSNKNDVLQILRSFVM